MHVATMLSVRFLHASSFPFARETRETRDRMNTGVIRSDVNRQHVDKDFPIVRLSLKFPWRIFGKYRYIYISKRKSAGRCRLKSNRNECNKVRCNFQPRSVNALFL